MRDQKEKTIENNEHEQYTRNSFSLARNRTIIEKQQSLEMYNSEMENKCAYKYHVDSCVHFQSSKLTK